MHILNLKNDYLYNFEYFFKPEVTNTGSNKTGKANIFVNPGLYLRQNTFQVGFVTFALSALYLTKRFSKSSKTWLIYYYVIITYLKVEWNVLLIDTCMTHRLWVDMTHLWLENCAQKYVLQMQHFLWFLTKIVFRKKNRKQRKCLWPDPNMTDR